MIRKGLRPRLKFGFERHSGVGPLRVVFPFRRSWVAIGVLAVFDAAFIVPAVLTFNQAADAWSRLDSLFDLVAAIFLTAWLMGWSIAPLAITALLLAMFIGREVLRAGPAVVEVWIGIAGLGLAAIYDAGKMRNLRLETPPPKSGHSWRGPHLVFDYGANAARFGSDLEQADARRIESRLETVTGARIMRGEAAPEDVGEPWEKPAVVSPLLSAADRGAPTTASEQPGSLTASAVALILANLVPIAGAAFFGWSLSDVMVLYWAESAIIGFFNVLKIAVIGRWSALFAGPFFLGHFGGFMAVHFLFIYTLFVKGVTGNDGGGDLAEVAALFAGLWPALLALFISHGYSFFTNFLGRQEYRNRSVGDQMREPYTRVAFMHMVLIAGGGLSLALGDPTPVLLLVIIAKIWLDLRAHRKQRQGAKSNLSAAGAKREKLRRESRGA